MRQTVFEETYNGITIDRVIRDYEYTMPTKHFHDEYEIYYLMEGERYYFIGQHTFHIKKGSLVIINRNEIHKTGTVSDSYHDRILIELLEEPFASFFHASGDLSLRSFFENYNGVIDFEPRDQSVVEDLLLGIQSELHDKKPGYQMSAMMKLSELLIFVMRYREEHAMVQNTAASIATHQKVDTVANYIVNHCAEDISLDSIAKGFYISKCYLSRIFKDVTGFTITEYINVHRIKLAQPLLTDTNLPVSEVAEQCGFDSLTYFEKVFRKYCEISPLKYRNDYKKLHHVRSKKQENPM